MFSCNFLNGNVHGLSLVVEGTRCKIYIVNSLVLKISPLHTGRGPPADFAHGRGQHLRAFRHVPQLGTEPFPALEEEVPAVSDVRLLQPDHHRYALVYVTLYYTRWCKRSVLLA